MQIYTDGVQGWRLDVRLGFSLGYIVRLLGFVGFRQGFGIRVRGYRGFRARGLGLGSGAW